MSFSAALKMEILENRNMRALCKQAQAHGLFLFAKGFSAESVLLATENTGILKLYISLLKDFLGQDVPIFSDEKMQNGKRVYIASLPGSADRLRLLGLFDCRRITRDIVRDHESICAFLSGAYLACGNITDPEKSYHIEFVIKNEALCGALKTLLDACLPGAKISRRRGGFVVYYKEYAQIEDLLTLMGAPKSCLAMIDVEMMKSVRNHVNRATNCETANIDKLVDASRSRIADISLVLERTGLEELPQDLREIAHLRLLHPDVSLRELGALATPALSRSGAHHRLERISRLAEGIRGEAVQK